MNIETFPQFINGNIYLNSQQMYLFPLNSKLLLLDFLISKSNSPLEIYKESFRQDALFLLQKISNTKSTPQHKLKLALNILSLWGVGEFSLKYLTSSKVIIVQDYPILNTTYLKLFRKKPKINLDLFLGENISCFCELLFKKRCLVQLSSKHQQNILKLSFREEINSSQKCILPYLKETKKYEHSKTLRKILSNKLIKLERGSFKVMHMYGILMPYLQLLTLISKLELKPTQEFFSSLGKVQGSSATSTQKQLFGIEGIVLFKQIIGQSDLSAIGKAIVEKETPQFTIKILTNLETHYQKVFPQEIKTLKAYFASNLLGVAETCFSKKATLIETLASTYTIEFDEKEASFSKKEKEMINILCVRSLLLD